MVKKEKISLKWSQIPYDTWIQLILVNPNECIKMVIPRKGVYIIYKAILINEYRTDRKVFDMVFPENAFKAAVGAVDPSLRSDLSKPIQFEFMKVKRGMFIRTWKQLDTTV